MTPFVLLTGFLVVSIVVSAYPPKQYNSPPDLYQDSRDQYNGPPDASEGYSPLQDYTKPFNGIPCPLPKKIEVDIVSLDNIQVVAQNIGSYQVKIDLTIDLTNDNARGATFDQTTAAISLPGDIPFLPVQLEPTTFQIAALTTRRVQVSAFLSCPDELVPLILDVFEKKCVGYPGATLPLKVFIQAEETCEGETRAYELPGLTITFPAKCALLARYISVLQGAPIIPGLGVPPPPSTESYSSGGYEIYVPVSSAQSNPLAGKQALPNKINGPNKEPYQPDPPKGPHENEPYGPKTDPPKGPHENEPYGPKKGKGSYNTYSSSAYNRYSSSSADSYDGGDDHTPYDDNYKNDDYNDEYNNNQKYDDYDDYDDKYEKDDHYNDEYAQKDKHKKDKYEKESYYDYDDYDDSYDLDEYASYESDDNRYEKDNYQENQKNGYKKTTHQKNRYKKDTYKKDNYDNYGDSYDSYDDDYNKKDDYKNDYGSSGDNDYEDHDYYDGYDDSNDYDDSSYDSGKKHNKKPYESTSWRSTSYSRGIRSYNRGRNGKNGGKSSKGRRYEDGYEDYDDYEDDYEGDYESPYGPAGPRKPGPYRH